jgi:hypothetical protein
LRAKSLRTDDVHLHTFVGLLCGGTNYRHFLCSIEQSLHHLENTGTSIMWYICNEKAFVTVMDICFESLRDLYLL